MDSSRSMGRRTRPSITRWCFAEKSERASPGEEVTMHVVQSAVEEIPMPLRDHFRPPLDKIASWEGFHGGWPMVIVQHLRKELPPGYVAEPRVHSGSQVEIDVATFEKANAPFSGTSDGNGGVATAVWAPAQPSLAVETTLPDYDEYEV